MHPLLRYGNDPAASAGKRVGERARVRLSGGTDRAGGVPSAVK
jgi:hypothetical protein